MTDLAPSVVRSIILEEHEQLRVKLRAIEAAIDHGNDSGLQNLLREFNHFFLKHIATEERILRPVLKDIDSWGDVRVDRMNKEHALQREEIEVLDKLIASGRRDDYLPPVKKFIAALYCDMLAEESECLHPDLLKDDPITVNAASS